jgi:tol-pal system protein YbgF
MKKREILFFLLPIWLLAGGCALQATVVDLETDLETLKKHQQALQERLEGTEKALRERAVPKGQAEMVSKVDEMTTELQGLSGKIEETGHQLSTLTQKFEDVSFRLQEALDRLESLEARVGALEKIAASRRDSIPDEGESRSRSLLPGRSLDGNPPRGGGGITPTEAYNLAYNDYLKGNYDLAIMGFKNFVQQFPSSSQVPHAMYWMGEAYYAKKDYPKAIEWFDRVLQTYPRSEKAVNSLLKKAYALQEQGKRDQAREAFRKVVEQYPFSNEADLAKNRLAELR